MLQELHITLLAVHVRKRLSILLGVYPVTRDGALVSSVQKSQDKNKANITNFTFQFSFPEKNFRVSWTKTYILY